MVGPRTIAVIGAGARGREIAQAAACGGYRIILEDLLPSSLRRAERETRSRLGRAVELGSLSAREAASAVARLEYAGCAVEAAREADFVIEAVPDDLESKIEIFTLLDKVCRPGTTLVSTTTENSISEIASLTYRPAQVVAMRFPLPMSSGQLIEVVRSEHSDQASVARAVAVGSSMGKQVRILFDTRQLFSSPQI